MFMPRQTQSSKLNVQAACDRDDSVNLTFDRRIAIGRSHANINRRYPVSIADMAFAIEARRSGRCSRLRRILMGDFISTYLLNEPSFSSM